MIKPTDRFSLILPFWKNLDAHCFHCFLTDPPTKQSENSELPDSSKTVTTVKTVRTVLWSRSFGHTTKQYPV
jgi:hypothetical protein